MQVKYMADEGELLGSKAALKPATLLQALG